MATIEDQENPLYCPHMHYVTRPKIFVGCNQKDIFDGKCETCGWNPKVSHQRLVKRFGAEKTKEFEKISLDNSWYKNPDGEVNNNDGTV